MSELKRKLLELLREDAEFRLAVAGVIGLEEVLAGLRELRAETLKNTEAIKQLQEQVAEHSRVLAEHTKVLEEHTKVLAEHTRALERLTEAVQQHSRMLSAVGARWGVLSEEAFRSAMKGIVEKIAGGKVEKWVYYDEKGRVFGYPSMVEVDLAIKDEEHILVEVKASVSRGDVRELWAVGKLYEELTGKKPRLAIVSPFIDQKGRELAEQLGVELYTGE